MDSLCLENLNYIEGISKTIPTTGPEFREFLHITICIALRWLAPYKRSGRWSWKKYRILSRWINASYLGHEPLLQLRTRRRVPLNLAARFVDCEAPIAWNADVEHEWRTNGVPDTSIAYGNDSNEILRLVLRYRKNRKSDDRETWLMKTYTRAVNINMSGESECTASGMNRKPDDAPRTSCTEGIIIPD